MTSSTNDPSIDGGIRLDDYKYVQPMQRSGSTPSMEYIKRIETASTPKPTISSSVTSSVEEIDYRWGDVVIFIQWHNFSILYLLVLNDMKIYFLL